MESWKNRVYESYMSNGFGDVHRMRNEFERYEKYYRKNYLQFMPENKDVKILELGCGIGHFLYFCKKAGYKNYEGIDASIENIEFIKSEFGEMSRVSVNDIMMYLSEGRRDTFDVVILNDVIEHLTKPEIFEVLEGINKVLKEKGILLVKTPNMANPFVSTAGRYIDITHEIGFTETSMRQVLRAVGFKKIKIIGTDVYVLNPIISIIAKIISKIINMVFFLFSALYGRTSLKIFEKDILAVAYKY